MGRGRVAMAGLAAMVGVAAIGAGVQISRRDGTATLATENTLIPQADLPSKTRDDVTATTFDLAVLAPTATNRPAPTVTPTTAKPTPTTVSAGVAIVHVNNATSVPVRVAISDASEHSVVLGAGETIDWTVKTTTTKGDSGSARVSGTNCGVGWTNANNVVGGREYHLKVEPSVGLCAGGQAMPQVVLTEYTNGTSRTLIGTIPDAAHALVYIVNRYDAPAKVTVNDDDTIEWTMDPTVWGAPQMLTTSTEHGDGVTVTRLDEACGYGDGDDYFVGGHTYRVEVVTGTGNCAAGKAPGLVIHDLTAQTTTKVGAN